MATIGSLRRTLFIQNLILPLDVMVGWVGGGVNQGYSRLSMAIVDDPWSYHGLQVGFGGVCRCMRVS